MALSDLTDDNFRSGFVALIGRPNVGKSTLLNQLLGKKVSITSPVAQTTRNRLRAILTTSKAQMVFVDTPGIHKPHHLLGERLVQSARRTIGEVDIVVLIFEGSCPPGRGDDYLVKLLQSQNIPVVVVLNKWDLISVDQYKQRQDEYKALFEETNWPLFSCSAIKGTGFDPFLNSISKYLPIGPYLYPPDMVSDQPEKVLLSDLIREQVLLHTREEVPHSVAVTIDRLEEMTVNKKRQDKKTQTAILATILVERKSQKGILIGKGGSMLKKIGQGARLQMKKLINGPVYLELFVKVMPDWRSKSSRLTELGYKGD